MRLIGAGVGGCVGAGVGRGFAGGASSRYPSPGASDGRAGCGVGVDLHHGTLGGLGETVLRVDSEIHKGDRGGDEEQQGEERPVLFAAAEERREPRKCCREAGG